MAFGFDKLLLQLRNLAIGQFARFLEFTASLCNGESITCLFKLALEISSKSELLLFRLPFRRQFRRFFFQISQLLFEALETILGSSIGFNLQRFALDLQLHDATVDFIQLFWLGINLHAQARCRLIDKINGLIGQETVGDITVRQGCRSNQSRIRNTHLVMLLVFFLQATQDRNRVLDGRFINEYRLKTTGKRCVLLDIFAVFFQRRRANAVQFTACKSRLQKVRCIHRAIRLACTDKRVHFIDEENDLAGSRLHFRKYCFQTLFELTAIFGTGNQRAHIERHQPLVLQGFGHIAIDDAKRQTFRDCGLADARLADQNRIVLGAARQNLNRAADFLVATDHRIKLACARILGQIAGIFLQRIIIAFSGRRIGGAAFAHIVYDLVERRRGHTGSGKNFRRLCGFFHRQRHQKALDGDETVTGLAGKLLGKREDLGKRLR